MQGKHDLVLLLAPQLTPALHETKVEKLDNEEETQWPQAPEHKVEKCAVTTKKCPTAEEFKKIISQ